MGVLRYRHRSLSPAEFSALLGDSGLTLDDFLYLTGRRRDQVINFLTDAKSGWSPVMADVMIAELAKLLGEDQIDNMFEIAARYDEGPPPKREKNL